MVARHNFKSETSSTSRHHKQDMFLCGRKLQQSWIYVHVIKIINLQKRERERSNKFHQPQVSVVFEEQNSCCILTIDKQHEKIGIYISCIQPPHNDEGRWLPDGSTAHTCISIGYDPRTLKNVANSYTKRFQRALKKQENEQWNTNIMLETKYREHPNVQNTCDSLSSRVMHFMMTNL